MEFSSDTKTADLFQQAGYSVSKTCTATARPLDSILVKQLAVKTEDDIEEREHFMLKQYLNGLTIQMIRSDNF